MNGVAFVVYRQVYEPGPRLSLLNDQFDRDHGSRLALRAFAAREAADAHLAELMRVARRTTNHFAVVDIEAHERAHEPEGGYDSSEAIQNAYHARVLALDLPWRSAPQAKWEKEHWEAWYDAEAPYLADEGRAKVWSLFDARPLYGISEVPAGDE